MFVNVYIYIYIMKCRVLSPNPMVVGHQLRERQMRSEEEKWTLRRVEKCWAHWETNDGEEEPEEQKNQNPEPKTNTITNRLPLPI